MHDANLNATALPCACTTLRKASRAITRIYDGELAVVGLNSSQLSILRALQRVGPMPLSRLAEEMVMERTSLYRALTPMARDGWLTIDDGSRGRTKLASLTAAGRDITALAAIPWERAQKRVVEGFGAAPWLELHGNISRLADIGLEGATS